MSEATDEVRDVQSLAGKAVSKRGRQAGGAEVREAGRTAGPAAGQGETEAGSVVRADAGRAQAEAGGPGADGPLARVIVGIDPGVTTGFAVWCPADKHLFVVTSATIARSMQMVSKLHTDGCLIRVVFEDARLRKWFGTKGSEALQGAGSIKRECGIWADWLELHGIPYRPLSPKAKGRKVSADHFKRITGWIGRTNEHARDAAMLVLGAK